MPEPSHRQLSQDHPHAFAIRIHDVRIGPPHEGELVGGVQMYHWAQEPTQLALYEGAKHRLDECADALDQLFMGWIPATLRSAACMGCACGPVHCVWAGPRNVSLSTGLEEEGYVDHAGGVCALYVCRI